MIALLDNLTTHLPFSLLDKKTLKTIEAASQIAYYPQDSVLIEEEVLPDHVYVIIKGVVKAMEGEELTDLYHENDIFGAIELIRKKGGKDSYLSRKNLYV